MMCVCVCACIVTIRGQMYAQSYHPSTVSKVSTVLAVLELCIGKDMKCTRIVTLSASVCFLKKKKRWIKKKRKWFFSVWMKTVCCCVEIMFVLTTFFLHFITYLILLWCAQTTYLRHHPSKLPIRGQAFFHPFILPIRVQLYKNKWWILTAVKLM